MKEIKVFLVDDKEIFREGLSRLLQEQPLIQLVYQCGNNQQMIEKVKATGPDILLIDADITRTEAIENLKQINVSSPDTRIAMLTDSQKKDQFFLAMQLGARGYLSKDLKVEDLVTAIDLIARGEIVISPIFSEQYLFASLRSLNKTETCGDKSGLSEREIEVLMQVTQGATNKEIAKTLFIAENTVKVHLKNILEKLQLRNRQQLAAYAVQRGLTTAITHSD
jgi:two-component system, NarL family, nitrate/nitrite response regulator NarL